MYYEIISSLGGKYTCVRGASVRERERSYAYTLNAPTQARQTGGKYTWIHESKGSDSHLLRNNGITDARKTESP